MMRQKTIVNSKTGVIEVTDFTPDEEAEFDAQAAAEAARKAEEFTLASTIDDRLIALQTAILTKGLLTEVEIEAAKAVQGELKEKI